MKSRCWAVLLSTAAFGRSCENAKPLRPLERLSRQMSRWCNGLWAGRRESQCVVAASNKDEIRSALRQLDQRLEGSVLLSGDDEAWNDAVIDSLTWVKPTPVPFAIVRAASEADVALAVPVLAQLQSQFGMPFRIRSGGHHYNGYSSIAQGIVLDLARLNSIAIEDGPESPQLAWLGPAVQGSNIWKDLIQKHNLGAIMGGCPAVNVGGFILGGGFSYWSRLYGLGCDRLVQARVVLANGDTVTADATNEHSDLFWALRGAGSAGVGGVATRLQVALFPTQDEQVYGMGKLPSVDQAANYLCSTGERSLPGNAGITLFLFPKKFFGEEFVAIFNWYDTGMERLKAGSAFLNETFHQILPPETAREFTLEIKSGTEQSKGGIMEGRLWRVWNGFLMPERNTRKVWTELLTLLKDIRDQGEEHVTVEILLWGGAISDTEPGETAFYWRQGLFNICINLGIPSNVPNAQAVFDEKSAFLERSWSKVEKHLEGVYYNYPVHGRAGSSKVYFGKNLRRLKQIKNKYDPDDVFHHPQSIRS